MKKKTMLLLSLVFAFIASASMLAFAATTHANADTVDGSATNLQFLDARMETDDGADKKLGLVINRNLGGDSYEAKSPTTDKVVYTVAEGGTRTLSKVYYKLFDGVTAGLVFSFAEDTAEDGAVVYGEGDTITFQSGFSFNTWQNVDLGINFPTDFTLTYTGGEWTGTFPDMLLTNITGFYSASFSVSANAVGINFGLTNPSGTPAFCDKANGWYTSGWGDQALKVYNEVSPYVTYYRGGTQYDYTRIMYGPGTFGVDVGGTWPVKNELVYLKKGFTLYDVLGYTNSGIGQMALGNNLYRPVLVLHKDVVFVCNGAKESWVATEPATTATFTNTEEEKTLLSVNTVIQLTWETDNQEPTPQFSSSDENIATVSDAGVVTGKGVGSVTITARFLTFSVDIELNVTAEPNKSGLTASVQTGATRDGKKGIVAYVGDQAPTKEKILDVVKQASYTYDNGATGVAFDLVADDTTVDTTDFDSTQAGETKVSITVGGQSCDIPVYVYETKTMSGTPTAKCMGSWGTYVYMNFVGLVNRGPAVTTQFDLTDANIALYGAKKDMITVTVPGHYNDTTPHGLATVGQFEDGTGAWYIFQNISANNYAALPVGTKFTLTDNFRLWRYIDGWWIADYKLAEPVSFVWTGRGWTDYVAEAEEVVLESEEITVPLNGSTVLEYSISPAGSYVTPTVAVTDTTVAELRDGSLYGLQEGETTVTFTIGEKVTTLTVKVEEIKIASLETTVTFGATRNEQKYLVAYKGETITPEYVAARVKANYVYSNETRGAQFDVTAAMVTVAEDATAAAGASKVTVTVTPEGEDPVSCEVPVWVYEPKVIGNPTNFKDYGEALDVWLVTQIEGNETAENNVLNLAQNPLYGIPTDMATFREPTHEASSANHALHSIGYASQKQVLLYFGGVNFSRPETIRVGSVLTFNENYRFYRFVDEYWVGMYKFAGKVEYVWTGSGWANYVGEATEIKVEEDEIIVPLNRLATLEYTVLPAGAYVTPTITIADETVAELRNGGLFGLKEGETTLTFTVNGKETELTVKVENLSVKALEAQVTFGATKEGKKYLVAYVGEAITADFVAARTTFNYVYANDSKSAVEPVPAAMVTIPENATATAGESKVVLTYTEEGADPVTCDIPVWVYGVSVLQPITVANILSWGDAMDIAFGNGSLIVGVEGTEVNSFNIAENPLYGVTSEMVYVRSPKHGEQKTYKLHSIGQVTNKQQILFFDNGLSGANVGAKLAIGSVLTFTENYRFYRWVDNFWVAMYKFDGKLEFVWTERGWDMFVADATGVEVEDTFELMHNARFELSYTLTPEGSFVTPTIESSNTDIVEVLADGSLFGKAVGEANVTITVCEDVKVVKVTVIESHPQGFVLGNTRSLFYVEQNEKFDLSILKAQVDYGDGYYGEAFALSEEIATMELDTAVAGRREVTINIKRTENGQEVIGTVTITVEVVEVVPQIPDSLWSCVDNGNFLAPAIAVHFQKTFPNPGNVTPNVLTPEQAATITNNITYTRDGQNIDVKVSGYLTFLLTLTPYLNDEALTQYQEGDVLTLKKGLGFYRWFGEVDGQNVPVGEGDYVKCGELEYDITFTFTNGNFFMEIQYVDGKAIAEKVTVGLGAQAVSNVVMVPEYATVGEWTFSSSDPATVSVNSRGIITGNKLGTATVTATLSGGKAGDKVVTFTVEVADTVKGIQFNVPDGLRVDLGTELTGAKLAELGVTATKIWASDKVEGAVDITDARITGYDPDTEGEQEITLRLNVDGKSVSGKIKITVGGQVDSGCGCSCGSSISPTMIFGGGCLIMIALLLLRRRKTA